LPPLRGGNVAGRDLCFAQVPFAFLIRPSSLQDGFGLDTEDIQCGEAAGFRNNLHCVKFAIRIADARSASLPLHG